MHTLRLKYVLRVTVHLQYFIALKLMKEGGTDAMIKYDQYFHQMHIFIKIANPLLIILRMVNLNQPHTDKLGFMILMFDYRIRMSMPELNYEDHPLPVT